MDHFKHQNYKSKYIEMKYLNNKRIQKIVKVNNSLLELEKVFKKLKDKEIKIRKEIEKIFNKLMNASIEDMDKFEEREMMKKRPFNLFPRAILRK